VITRGHFEEAGFAAIWREIGAQVKSDARVALTFSHPLIIFRHSGPKALEMLLH
jgi:hypothetical protein